ncbi:MAG TPA: 3-oxoacyl-[acyl-carrier-protein] reductase [Clostridiales bacterium]|nr:3-oxoacyl-[acyl-carrier-protein] reductase [Clostridiales bacterium]
MLYLDDIKILKDKVAVVTGASRGIGKAIAISLARCGADIAIINRGNAQNSEQTVEEIKQCGAKAKAYQCDVSDFNKTSETVAKILEDFSTIDILVNNAGITIDKLVLAMTEEDFAKVLDVNLKGAFNMIRHICPIMAKKRYGKIINISSVSGIMGNVGQANYAASKAGLIGLSKTVAKEYASRNIKCNAIAPGFIKTDMTDQLNANVKEQVINAIPMKKMGETQDVANLAVFLASPYSDYITGEVIKVDGGLFI